jgi:hypothetical protein
LRLIPHFDPVMDVYQKDRKIINSNVLSFFASGSVNTSQRQLTTVNANNNLR